MADVTRSVDIIFGATDKTGTAITGISKDLDALSGKVGDVAEPLAKAAEKVLALETALGVLAAGGMALAVSKSSEFGQSFAEITTLISQPKEALSGFKDDILTYAQDSTQSIDSINKSVYDAISAGVDYKDSLGVVGSAEKLAVAGKADLDATTKTLVSTLNAYGASMSEAGRYSDILFTAVKDGQTTIPELSTSIAEVTGIAAGGKVPFETLAAAIAGLTASGLPTSQAITGIKAALSNIIKPSSEAEKAAAALGIQFDASALKTKGFDGVLQDVYKATGGNVSKMAELFGSVEGLNAVMVLAADKSGKFKQALDDMKTSSGATSEAYGKMKDEFANVSKTLVNNIDTVLIKIGDKFIPGVSSIEKGLIDAFKGIATAVDDGSFKPLFDAIDRFTSSLGGQISDIGKMLPEALKNIDYTDLIASVSGLGTSLGQAFNALFAGLDLTTPEGLSDAIQKVVDGITALTNVTSGIVDAWKPFLTVLGEAVDWFTSLDASTQKNVGEILGWAQQISAAAAGVGILTAALSLIGSGLSSVGGIISTSAAAVSDFTIAGTALGATLTTLTAGAAAFYAGWKIGEQLYNGIPIVKDYGDALGAAVYSLTHWSDEGAKATAASEAQAVAAKNLADQIGAIAGKYGDIPDQKTVEIKQKGIQDAIDQCRAAGLAVEDIPKEKLISVMLGGDDISRFKSDLDGLDTEKVIEILTTADSNSIDAIVALLKEKLPQERIQEIKTHLEEEGYYDIANKLDGIRTPITTTFSVKRDSSVDDTKSYVEYWFSQKDIDIKVKATYNKDAIDQFKKDISELTNEKIVDIITHTDKSQLNDFANAIDEKLPQSRITQIIAELKEQGFEDAAKAIEKAVPSEKDISVTVDPNKAIEAVTEITKSFNDLEKSKIEWTAKLNIADMEVQTKRIEAAFGSINEGIKSTGDVLNGLFDLFSLVDSSPNIEPYDIEKWIEREYALREQEFELQGKLVDAQVEAMNARTQALLNGDGLIKIETTGMEPALEELLFSICKKLQTKVSQSGGDLLLGISK